MPFNVFGPVWFGLPNVFLFKLEIDSWKTKNHASTPAWNKNRNGGLAASIVTTHFDTKDSHQLD